MALLVSCTLILVVGRVPFLVGICDFICTISFTVRIQVLTEIEMVVTNLNEISQTRVSPFFDKSFSLEIALAYEFYVER